MKIELAATTFAVLLVCASQSVAQPGRGRGPDVSPGMLLGIEEVQRELDLSEEQLEGIKELRAQRPGRGGGRPPRRDDRDGGAEQQREGRGRPDRAARHQQELAAIGKILTDPQQQRLQQIVLQIRGPRALTDPPVVEKLGLTDDEVDKLSESLEAAMDDMRAQMRELFQDAGGDFDSLREKMTELRKEVETNLLAELTAEQREHFETLKGEPFEVPASAFRGRGRGRGRGQFGRGPGGDRPDRPSRPRRPAQEEF